MPNPLLQVDNVTVRFGGLIAVDKLSFQVAEGSLMGVIGPNGAGKTTVFNVISGVYQPTSGQITFADNATRNLHPHHLSKLGIARTFQNSRLFHSMSVLDNVRAATQVNRKYGIWNSLCRGELFYSAEKETRQHVMELLTLFSLQDFHAQPANSLSYGGQRRLEIVRALATQPKLLLLDEPAAGMNPSEKEDLMQLIQFIRKKFRLSILLIEHDMRVVMNVCEQIVVINHGNKIAEGTPKEIKADPQVIEAYLGAPAH